MSKRLLYLLGLLSPLFSGILFAQQRDQSTALANSLLWKINGKDLSSASYLMGTIHEVCRDDYFFSDKMKKAFAASEQLWLEIDLDDPAAAAEYQKIMFLPEGKRLSDYFTSEAEFSKFSATLQDKTGINASLFQQFKPLILLSMMAHEGFACSATESYEKRLMELAKERGIQVNGLETIAAQVKIFDNMGDEEIRAVLLQSVDDLESDSKIQNRMVLHFKNENIDSLHALIMESGDFKQFEKVLLENRNRDWVQKLPGIMKNSPAFIAVGAGHLAGNNGLIRLLREKGYTVEPVF